MSFKYDSFGRRIYKPSSAGASVFAYDGDNLIEATNSSGTVVARDEDTQSLDEPLAILRSGATSYFHANSLGSITSLSNAAGSIANTYSFAIHSATGSWVNPFQYTARNRTRKPGCITIGPDTTTRTPPGSLLKIRQVEDPCGTGKTRMPDS